MNETVITTDSNAPGAGHPMRQTRALPDLRKQMALTLEKQAHGNPQTSAIPTPPVTAAITAVETHQLNKPAPPTPPVMVTARPARGVIGWLLPSIDRYGGIREEATEAIVTQGLGAFRSVAEAKQLKVIDMVLSNGGKQAGSKNASATLMHKQLEKLHKPIYQFFSKAEQLTTEYQGDGWINLTENALRLLHRKGLKVRQCEHVIYGPKYMAMAVTRILQAYGFKATTAWPKESTNRDEERAGKWKLFWLRFHPKLVFNPRSNAAHLV